VRARNLRPLSAANQGTKQLKKATDQNAEKTSTQILTRFKVVFPTGLQQTSVEQDGAVRFPDCCQTTVQLQSIVEVSPSNQNNKW
jgi:hypothetical protein